MIWLYDKTQVRKVAGSIPGSGVSTVLFLLSIPIDHTLHDTLLAASIRMHDTHASSNACHEIGGYPSICMVPHNGAPSTDFCPPPIDVYMVLSCRQVCGCHACTFMHQHSVLVICASNQFLDTRDHRGWPKVG